MRRCRWQTRRILASATLLVAVLSGVAGAGEGGRTDQSAKSFTAEQVRFFEEKVRPILETRCLKCHGGGGKVKGGFRLDSRAAVLKGGELGPAVDADQPEQSLLLQAIRYEELEMPPGRQAAGGRAGGPDPLGQGRAALGFAAGRPSPPAAPPPASPASAPSAIAAARGEWSHRPVVRPPVPAVKDRGLGPQPDRCVPPGPARGRAAAPRARGRPRHPDPPAGLRPHRPAPHPRGGRRLPRRPRARGLRAAGRSAARLAPLRRALGPALARPGPLRRDQRLRARLGQAVRLAVPRLRDRRLQPRQAVRPVRPRATGRRRDRARARPRP